MSRFLRELGRRKVTRVAATYVIVGIAVVEGADVLGTPLGLPAWVLQSLDLLVVLGFPLAVVLAWALEMAPPEGPGAEDRSPSTTSTSWTGPFASLAAFALVCVLLGGYLFIYRDAEESPRTYDQRVGVLPLGNRTGDPTLGRIGEMAAHWITDGLSRLPGLEVVPAEVAFSFASAQLAGLALPAGNPLLDFAGASGAGLVVSGAYYAEGDSLLFQIEITEARSGRAVGMISTRSGADATMEAADELRRRTMAALAARLDADRDGAEAIATASGLPLYEAYRSFLEGLEAFWRLDYPAAYERFARAMDLDPDFVPARLWLARTLIQEQLPDRSLARAGDLLAAVAPGQEGLAPLDRLFYEYLCAYIAHDLPGVLAAWERIVEVSPEVNGFLGILGMYAINNGRYHRAVEVLRRTSPDRWGYGRAVPRWHALALHAVGEHEEALEVLRQARVRFPDEPSLLLGEVGELAVLGRLDEVRARAAEAERLGPQAISTPGAVLRRASLELLAHGSPEASRALADEAVRREETRTPPVPLSLATSLLLAGRAEEAWAVMRPLEERYPPSVPLLGRLGMFAAAAGERSEALRFSELLDAEWPAEDLGMHSLWRARIAALLGDRDDAVALLERAFAEGCAYVRFEAHLDAARAPLLGYPPYEELMRPRD